MLFKNFDKHIEKTALILPNKINITYGELQQQVDHVVTQLGNERKLIFITVSNNLASIITYIACIQNDHPMLLLNTESQEQNKSIIAAYQPNIMVDATGDKPLVDIQHDKSLNLHPELCLLLTTSGSTGSPKLVKLSHNNIYTNTKAIANYLDLTKIDRAITSLKFHYSYGLSIINSHLHVGASIVLTENSINEPCFWQDFAAHKVTSFSGVPYSFEILAKKNFEFKKLPSLRYLTQAGGRLSSSLIKLFANAGKNNNFKFYVMYGQTEASPRMSYLPPEHCVEYPDYIGIAIPSGEIALVNENNKVITTPHTVGELVYKGPNIMMGYAKNYHELAIKEHIDWLHTGDLAFFNEINLFRITGRKSRFAKPFGIRVNLDDIQHELNALGLITAVSINKEVIVIAIELPMRAQWLEKKILNLLEQKHQINPTAFSVHFINKLPLLSNGKLDFKSVACLATSAEKTSNSNMRLYWQFFKEELLYLSGLKQNTWRNLTEIYSQFFNGQHITDASSFVTLAGDSLLYVSIAIELELYLGHLPNDWHLQSIATLELMRHNNAL